jgi:mRNA interferase MazF
MVISQGDVYWIEGRDPSGSEPGFRRPVVVLQNDLFNRSRIGTVVVCHLISNLKRAHSPGNVLLAKGQANLPKRSVVNVTQVATLDRAELIDKIGTLSHDRLIEILDGVYLLLKPWKAIASGPEHEG